ncbi:Probable intracellular septation protein A [Serratia symbiotica]|nr:Probable intracellular septation protein A [Serratia symbiotica]
MKQFLEFISLIIFFIFYKLYDIYLASKILIGFTILTFILTWIKYRKLDIISLITVPVILFFSTLTLIFHNDLFIKWKVTIIYIIFALILFFSQIIFKKPLLQYILNKELILPNKVWINLNFYWMIFFLICGLVNIYIALWLPQSIWVNFKVFGLTLLTFIMTCITGIYIYKYTKINKK